MPSAEDIELLAQKRQQILAGLEEIKSSAGENVYHLERRRRIRDLDWPFQRNLQAPLLERARSAGLLSDIAEYTGREIPPIKIYTEEDLYEHQTVVVDDSIPDVIGWPSLEDLRYVSSPGWKAHLLIPSLKEYETWDLSLVISCTKDTIDVHRRPQRFNVSSLIVVDTNGMVTIKGRQIEFTGLLQASRGTAVGRAFEDPLFPLRRFLRGPLFRDIRHRVAV